MRPIRDDGRILLGLLTMAAVLFLATFFAIGMSVPVDAGSQPPREYAVTELPSLGGSSSAANSINNAGSSAGYSLEAGDETMHATLWRHGELTDLETMGGPNSAVLWPNKNHNGLVVGVTETEDLDPNEEQWSCSFFFPGDPTGHVCLGFVWEDGEMRTLDTHGGTHGFATGVNNQGQVVGWAETSEVDDECVGRDQVLRFVGALWDTRDGDRIHELPPLPGVGDEVSTGNAINDQGQVVGISGDCDQAVGRFSARHMVLWEDGVPMEIPSFGGVTWNTPMAINNKGAVVGFANDSADDGDDFNERAFLWTRDDGTRDLLTLDEDTNAQALGINNSDQIVGLSRGEGGASAVIWLEEKIFDLNELTPDYDGHLIFANDITGRGAISGQAIAADGTEVAFVATPVGKK